MIAATATVSSSVKSELNLRFIWTVCVVAALGGLLFGWDWVVIGGAKPFFEPYFNLPVIATAWGRHPAARLLGLDSAAALSGLANSCALLGCLAASLVTGYLSDKFGRKRLLILAGFLFAASSLLTGWASSFGYFILWRIAGGTAIGMASSLSPMFIAEIAPAQWRGRLVSVNQLTIVIGILIAQLLNLCVAQKVRDGATPEMIAQSWDGQYGWRWMFTLVAVPSLVFFFSSMFLPESPRWLAKNGRTAEARGVLEKVGGKDYADGTLRDIQATLSNESARAGLQVLFQPAMLRALLLGVVLAVFQQWCGINVIFNYAEDIFRAAGYDISSVLTNIAWTGSVNMVFTFVALGAVDRNGRRPLMLFGAGSLALIYAALGFCYHSQVHGWPMLVLVLAAIGCYAMSLAPVTWVVISEIFPNRIRGTAMAVAVAALWAACFLLTYTFPILNKKLGADRTFWLYAAICAGGFIFLCLRLPETKGKSLEQIERELTDA